MKNPTKAYLLVLILAVFLLNCENPANTTAGGGSTPQSPAASASTATVTGEIRTGQFPIQNVAVTLVGGLSNQVAYTDQNGHFEFSGLDNGQYVLYFYKYGWTLDVVPVLASGLSRYGVAVNAKPAQGFMVDSWGNLWDSVSRTADTWNNANTTAQKLGGRLPTPTEVYRLNAMSGTKEIGSGDYLWTNIMWSVGNYTVVYTATGNTSYVAEGSGSAFRVIYPSQTPSSFTGNSVMTMPGQPGKVVKLNGKKFVVDTMDRPSLPLRAAQREAMFYKAWIPTTLLMTAMIQDGLPNGSGAWLNTVDYAYVQTEMMINLIKWSGTQDASFSPSATNITWAPTNDSRPYRMMGLASEPTPNPISLADGYSGPSTRLVSTKGNYTVTNYNDAVKNAFSLGGHLPSLQDLILLQYDGLQNEATATYLWSAEVGGSYKLIYQWKNTFEPWNPDYSNITQSDFPSTTLRKYKPVFYPIDSTYAGPTGIDPTTLFVYQKDMGNGKIIKIWVDKSDRPAATIGDAIYDAYQSGGFIPSRRDYLELVTAGLPNGSNDWLYTSEQNYYPQVSVFRWTGVANPSTFNDVEGPTGTGYAINLDTSLHPYRRMWTNELRTE